MHILTAQTKFLNRGRRKAEVKILPPKGGRGEMQALS